MKALNIIISKMAIIFMGIVSIILIVLPFNNLGIFSISDIGEYMNIINNQYIYSLIGIILLLLSIKGLFSGMRVMPKNPKHIITPMNFGNLIISEEAIKGLTYNVITKTVGIREPKIEVNFNELGLEIFIKGQVSPEINIPEMTRNVQVDVKETIQGNTGLEVSSVNIEVSSISTPVKTLR